MTWNVERLHEILQITTDEWRKGDSVVMAPGVIEVFAMPPIPHPVPDHIMLVDCHFIAVGVNLELAEPLHDEVIDILNDFPPPLDLFSGPSYIAVGAVLGSQSAAFRLFALGQALGLWQVLTPKALGVTGDLADQMAGAGYVMVSGYNSGD